MIITLPIRKCISLLCHRLPTDFLFLKHSVFYSTHISDPTGQPSLTHLKNSKINTGHQKNKTHQSYHEYLYGRSACQIAMKISKRPIFKVIASEVWLHSYINDKRVETILYIAAERNIPIEYRSVTALYNLSKGRPHQGVCLKVGHFTPLNMNSEIIQEFISEPVTNSLPLWVYLDGLKDPMNVGAILRTCHFLGINRIILSPYCSSITATVNTASSGAAEILSIYSVGEDNTRKFFEVLKDSDWDIIGTDALHEDTNSHDSSKNTYSNIVDVREARLSKPTILVLGSEGYGMSNIARASCSKRITIKQREYGDDLNVPCLNVSAAAAIILHKLSETR